jgi:hypothetical protein
VHETLQPVCTGSSVIETACVQQCVRLYPHLLHTECVYYAKFYELYACIVMRSTHLHHKRHVQRLHCNANAALTKYFESLATANRIDYTLSCIHSLLLVDMFSILCKHLPSASGHQ